MDIKWSRDESELMHYRSSLVLASRANGLAAPIDTVWINMQDADDADRNSAGLALLRGLICYFRA
jgi:citrate lyase subunit beta/citryl-CoA lyase